MTLLKTSPFVFGGMRHEGLRFALLIGVCAPSSCAGIASDAESAEQDSAKRSIRVAVDPRVELFSILFRLAGNPEYGQGKVKAYTEDVEEHFEKLRDHSVVKMARTLRQRRGVSYDAVMSMAVHVTDAYTLAEITPLDDWPDALDRRWRLHEARAFLEAARQFVKEASFREFVEERQPLYDTTAARMRTVLENDAHLEWFEQFFGRRPQASFTVALGLLNGGGCYGPRCRTSDGEEELYCVLGVWKTDAEGVPQFDRSMLGTVIHEFCHSYANAVIDGIEAELKGAGEKIFPHVEAAMRRQAYGNWKTMMCESLVRACVVRYVRQYDGRVAARTQVGHEKQRQFLWIDGLSDLLGQYEAHRDTYPTLEAFAPRIVEFFNKYADSFAKTQDELAAKRPAVVSMTPADQAADVDPTLTEIRVVFDRPMMDQSWSLVGGGPDFPEIVGKPAYDAAGKVWTVSVKLKPTWSYRFMLNSDRFAGFKSREGVPLAPVTVSFKTGAGK